MLLCVLTVDMERPREALLALVLEVNANELRAKDAAAKALSDKRLELEGMSNKELRLRAQEEGEEDEGGPADTGEGGGEGAEFRDGNAHEQEGGSPDGGEEQQPDGIGKTHLGLAGSLRRPGNWTGARVERRVAVAVSGGRRGESG